MRLSHYFKTVLFAPFFASFNAASWPTYSSIAFEATLKPTKKIIKNLHFRIVG